MPAPEDWVLPCENPIACTSKSISTTQQNYTQIEKEMLAVIFIIRRIYGIPNVIVNNDSKPLEAILKSHYTRRHLVPPQFLCCIILTPPTQHLCLEEAGMWCLTGLENGKQVV